MENNFDVIIAGCGAAGLYGAINLPASCRVLLVCKQELTLCNSALAQGGIAGVYKSPQDSIELHEHDTMVAGGFKNNPETLHILTTHAAHEIQAILDRGILGFLCKKHRVSHNCSNHRHIPSYFLSSSLSIFPAGSQS